ncbi:hypothetical protein niasHT_009721 [Heterodera trifolii]|uniref:SPRY domain-containing protein n=1 Tax=Heterodera trifolii TaxID=157864 RepID=A0ABD2MDI1_9BILA
MFVICCAILLKYWDRLKKPPKQQRGHRKIEKVPETVITICHDEIPDNQNEAKEKMAKAIFIYADCWLCVFDLLPAYQLGLGIAMISHRFDFYVNEHFKTRKWKLGKMRICHKIGENGTKQMQIVNSDGNPLPIPQNPLPNKVIGFRDIEIIYIDQNVVEFLRRFHRFFAVRSMDTPFQKTRHQHLDLVTSVKAKVTALEERQKNEGTFNAALREQMGNDLKIIDTEHLMVQHKGAEKDMSHLDWTKGSEVCRGVALTEAMAFFLLKTFPGPVKMHNVLVVMFFGFANKPQKMPMSLDGEIKQRRFTYAYENNAFYWVDGRGRKSWHGFSGGDTVGCGINLATRHVFFTKNGKRLGS